jgi:signal transduction histidine kinase
MGAARSGARLERMIAEEGHERRIDVLLVLAGLGLTVLAVKTPWSTAPGPVIALAGAVSSGLLPLRRRWPTAVALTAAAGNVLSGNPLPLLAGLFAAGDRGSRRWTVLVVPAGVAGWFGPDLLTGADLRATSVAGAVLATALLVGAGAHAATRRRLAESLRERAERAEAQRYQREEHARGQERARIAREMHDVVAHKVALISVHAGGLEVNPAAGPEATERTAALIRVTAQEALAELRDVLGVLRDHDGGPGSPGSEPLADVAGVVGSWRTAGMDVDLRDDAGRLPPVTARAVHRIVQEGLTNVHKHAPGAAASVTVTRDGADVVVQVTNQIATGPALDAGSGSGAGLAGLAERVRTAGGTMRSGPADGGGWHLRARLPLDRGH